MQVLNPDVSVESFFERVARSPGRALLLDYDGTLAPFSADRDRAFPYPGVAEALERILAAGTTRIGLVSGRAAGDVPPLLGLEPPPEIWGSHGLEHLAADGSYRTGPAEPSTTRTIEEACDWIAKRGWVGLLERKPFGLALHARGTTAEAFSRAREAVLGRWADALAAANLEALEFDGGIEWRPSGGHKGDVVRTVLSEMGSGAAVAYLGDDRTDEDAFRALHGKGLAVLVRGELRSTAADLWLSPPGELLEFLENWRRAAGGRN